MGLAGMFARRAEVQAARAAETIGVPFVESTLSICSIEEVAEATTKPPWFQLYVMRDRGYVELMARAQAVGSSILVLTVDLAVVGARHPRYAQCGRRPAERLGEIPPSAGSPQPPALDLDRGARRPATDLRQPWRRRFPGRARRRRSRRSTRTVRPECDLEDVAWMRERWRGPGGEGRARSRGRPPRLGGWRRRRDRLQPRWPPARRRAFNRAGAARDRRRSRRSGRVLADGGVRTGLDVVKMVAMGARAVLVGRPWAWPSRRGEAGVQPCSK